MSSASQRESFRQTPPSHPHNIPTPAEVQTSIFPISRPRKSRCQDLDKPDVQTSEKPMQVILIEINLSLVIAVTEHLKAGMVEPRAVRLCAVVAQYELSQLFPIHRITLRKTYSRIIIIAQALTSCIPTFCLLSRAGTLSPPCFFHIGLKQ